MLWEHANAGSKTRRSTSLPMTKMALLVEVKEIAEFIITTSFLGIDIADGLTKKAMWFDYRTLNIEQ